MAEVDTGTLESAQLFGYDYMKVPYTHCIMCGREIGLDPYVEDCAFQRFGQMFVIHLKCFGTLNNSEQSNLVRTRNRRLAKYAEEAERGA